MSNFKVKYVVDGVTKTTEGSRPANFGAVRQAVARGSGKGSFGLRYTSGQGDYAVDSDASLATALKDAESRRLPYLRVVVTAQGSAGPSAPEQPAYAPPPQAPSPRQQSQQQAPPAQYQAPPPAAQAARSAPAGTVAQFTLPGSGQAEKIKVTPEQTENYFLFTPVPSRYQTDVTVVLEGTRLIYNNQYTFQDGAQLKTMNLTQTFNLPYAPRTDQVVVNGSQIKLLL